MYKFERRIEVAKECGIELTDAQVIYLQCARVNGIDLLNHLYEECIKPCIENPQIETASESLQEAGVILTLINKFDESLCELVDQMVHQNTAQD